MFVEKYQVVNRACADCVNEVNEELDDEDGNKERRLDAARCVPGCGAESPRKVEKGLL